MRIIDADALKEELFCVKITIAGVRYGKNFLCEILTDFYKHLFQAIDDAPTIDAVPVVRCGECKYWLHMEDGFGDCTNRRFHIPNIAPPSMDKDDFCSCGERRSND